MLVLSAGIVKLIIGYSSLAKKAANSETAACRLLQHHEITQIEAFRVMYEYHVDRATALIIPTWLWNQRRKELNEIWTTHRSNTQEKIVEP